MRSFKPASLPLALLIETTRRFVGDASYRLQSRSSVSLCINCTSVGNGIVCQHSQWMTIYDPINVYVLRYPESLVSCRRRAVFGGTLPPVSPAEMVVCAVIIDSYG